MNSATRFILIAGFLSFASLVCAAALFGQTRDAEHRQKITVRVVDGITGLPVWFDSPNIWVGPTTGRSNPRLNARGEVKIDITEATPRMLRFLPNWYADCRYHGDVNTGAGVDYSLDDILESGVVVRNVCGLFHAKPRLA